MLIYLGVSALLAFGCVLWLLESGEVGVPARMPEALAYGGAMRAALFPTGGALRAVGASAGLWFVAAVLLFFCVRIVEFLYKSLINNLLWLFVKKTFKVFSSRPLLPSRYLILSAGNGAAIHDSP